MVEGISRALDLFDKMRHSQNYLPNVITFVTIFRSLGRANLHLIGSKETHTIIMELLNCAQEISADDRSSLPNTEKEIGYGVVVDITIYNAALSTCVWLSYPNTAQDILLDMTQRGSKLNTVSYKIVSKLVNRWNKGPQDSMGINSRQVFIAPEGDMLLQLVSVGAVTAEESAEIRKVLAAYVNRDVTDKVVKNATPHASVQYAGCLGADAAEDLRRCVIDHDLRKLIERPEGFSESDFATLIHQCRKRKWPNQVNEVLSFMTQRVNVTEEHSTIFNPSPSMPSTSHPWLSTESSYNLRRCIVPLTWTIYEAAFDAYFCMDMGDEAFTLYNIVLRESVDSPSLRKSLLFQDNMSFILKGFLRCGRDDCAAFAFDSYCSKSPPSRQLVMGLMHGLGRGSSVHVAMRIIADIFERSCCRVGGKVQSLKTEDISFPPVELNLETEPFSLQSCKVFLLTLLESCAILGNIEGFMSVLQASLPKSSCTESEKTDVECNMIEEDSFTYLLLRELIIAEDCDLVAICLMASASQGDVSIAHEYLHSWQSPPLLCLPPYLFLHGLVAESFAQTTSADSQINAASRIKSLPFRGFARFGAVRHLDKRRSFIRKAVSKSRIWREKGGASIADIHDKFLPISSQTAHSSANGSNHLASSHNNPAGWRYSLSYIMDEKTATVDNIDVSVDQVSINRDVNSKSCQDNGVGSVVQAVKFMCVSTAVVVEEEDVLLTRYLLATLCLLDDPVLHCDLKSRQVQHDSALPCLLLLQHLETRLLRVRDKNAKFLLNRQIVISFSVALERVIKSATAVPSDHTHTPSKE